MLLFDSKQEVIIIKSNLLENNASTSHLADVECLDYTEQLYVNLSTFWYCFLALITTAGLLISSVSNMIIIYLFTRNPSNIIAINLSISDMLYCIQWPSVIYCCLTQTTWILEYDFVCKSLGFITVSTALVSILTVVTMSVERAIVVKYSIHAKNHLTIRYAWFIIILIWLICICSCIPPLFGKFNRYTLDPSKTSCTLDYLSSHTDHKLYILVLYIGYYFVPMIAITISYAIIIATFNKSSLSLKEVSACNDELNIDMDNNNNNNNLISSSSICSKTEMSFFPPSCVQAAIASASTTASVMPLRLTSSVSSTTSSSSSISKRAIKLKNSFKLRHLYKKKQCESKRFLKPNCCSNYYRRENFSRRSSYATNNNNINKIRRTSVNCVSGAMNYLDEPLINTKITTASHKNNTNGILTKENKFQQQRRQTANKISASINLLPNLNINDSCVHERYSNNNRNLSTKAATASPNHTTIFEKQEKVDSDRKCAIGSRSSIRSLAPKFYKTLTNNNTEQRNLDVNIVGNSDKNERLNKLNRSLASVTNSTTCCYTQSARSSIARSALQFRLAKMSFYLILLWLISWSPIAWLAMINSILKCRRASATAVFIGSLMTKMNYFNSFLYTLSQPKLKNKFLLIIKRVFCVNKS